MSIRLLFCALFSACVDRHDLFIFSTKESTMEILYNLLEGFSNGIYLTLIKDNRYEVLIRGFGNSILITVLAAAIGILLGLLLAILRLRGKGILASFANGYITVIRGTPSVVQLTVIYFIILGQSGLPDVLVASIAFGINSGAYVAEIIRAGIMAVDRGQMEAGRSLGLSYPKTMRYVIVPQAIKNVLPALGNELIVLVKETAIAGYIGVVDLQKGGVSIASVTYNYMVPLLCVAYIYLLLTTTMAAGLNVLERRLRRSD